jgi:phage gpG-like protein
MKLIEISRGKLAVTIEIEGDDDVKLGLSRAADAISDWTDFWIENFAPKFYGDIEKNFQTEGSLVGGWPALSPSYAKWKDAHYPGQPIMRLTDALYRSLTFDGHNAGPQGIFNPTHDGLDIGTQVPYAARHQDGDGVPQRQIAFIGNADEYRQLIQRWVRVKTRNAGMPEGNAA